MSRRRVVITGLGLVTPLGNTVSATWQKILAGQSGISTIDFMDVANLPTKFTGAIKDLDITEYMPAKQARKMDMFIQYGLVAAIQAIKDAGFEVSDANADRIGTVIGSGIGGISTIEQNVQILNQSGPRRISPFFVPASIVNMASGQLSMMYNLRGPNYAISTACTTGTHCIGLAARNIAYDEADIMVAGGAEKASAAIGMAGFSAARALSTRNDDPEKASRPWDKDRDGFVLSDGAGVLVLEEYEHAKRRGATIYAELTGFGMSADAFHVTAPPEDGRGALKAMENALKDARLSPEQINYINAHGTSTPVGDVAESRAVEQLMGSHATVLAMSSTKSMTGHLLGAAGAIEAAFTALAIRDQIAPPTINLDNPDPECTLDYVPHEARSLAIEYALSNSFGFGGTNASLVFAKV
ncbi:beta-ketoacyl-ACP synthase II [Endozoicomonas sp. SM1973]|uniref:3-oxoacyl-[acyl-carrier-protein] synthase 2 n=1 Tax=Spartinivicinus marinus TaxID=2994442 RepID=A0A853HUS5_9GAMM|nr:beta-ketoacyl-ACP synthase II [Spartinivicinus marinus]NYZ65013.1 beta-ketoacyl-ACP synthase II [Spartinivicinus marinus]